MFTLLLCIVSVSAFAQDYNVNSIPDSLKQKVNAVLRFEELKVSILSTSKAKVKHSYAITILNEAGDEFSGYEGSYSKMYTLNDLSGHLYDASGKQLKSVKKKDIADLSNDDDASLITDTRIKKHNFYYKQYPFTVEYEEEKEIDGIFFLPHWQPLQDENFAVQQSRFIVDMPADYNLRYKQFNYTGEPKSVNNGKSKTLTWEISNRKNGENEMFQPSLSEVTTLVFIAPEAFEIAGYKGDMSSWLSFGKFVSQLNSGRDELPDNIKQEVHKLTDGLAGKEEKIKALYEFMQKNTRYIGIQIGIGSWQPFDAKYVAAKRYGDCKALSNYMKSLLKEAGIAANYVLVNSGNGLRLWEDFPAPYFNHVILCVPGNKDTLWLECTSPTESAGFMGSSTGNRKALMINDDGGHVVNTPFYKAADNVQLRKIDAIIDASGNLTADVYTRFSGIQEELQHFLMYDASKEQRDRHLNSTLSLPTYAVEKTNYKETKGRIPFIDEYLRITSPNYASATGKRLFIVPNMFNRSSTRLPTDEPRKNNIEFPYPFVDVDTILVALPQGYEPEALPKNVDIQNKFGKYSVIYKMENNRIEVIRRNEISANRFPATDYADLAAFFDQKYKSDRTRIVLVKKEE